MNLLDAFYLTVHSAAGGVEALAARMGTTAAVLRNKANPGITSNKPLLLDAALVQGITGDHRILHAMAAELGYVCVPVGEDTPGSDMAVLEVIAQVWDAEGAVGAEVHRALADGRITQAEVATIERAVKLCERALETLVARLKRMAEI